MPTPPPLPLALVFTCTQVAMESPLAMREDVIADVAEFVDREHFLHFAAVSRAWRKAWGNFPTVTRAIDRAQPRLSSRMLLSAAWSHVHRDVKQQRRSAISRSSSARDLTAAPGPSGFVRTPRVEDI